MLFSTSMAGVPPEREAAINFLMQPNLIERTNDCIGKAGVIGEAANRLLMYVIFTSRKRENPFELLQNTQRLLMPVSVRNPYAEQLQIPAEVLKPRRTNAHYLQFIEAITFYHQYQREKKVDKLTGEQFIEATLEDIAAANKLMKEVLLRKADELSGATRNYFEQLKELLQEQKQSAFSNKEIRKQLRLPGTTVRRYHNELLQSSYIKLQESKKQKGYCYEIVSYEEYAQLRNSITVVLDEILHRLRASEPPVSQKINGSIKHRAVKALASLSQ